MTREDWVVRTGDAAFVDKMLGAAARLRPQIDAAVAAGQAVDTVPGLAALTATAGAIGAACRKQAASLDPATPAAKMLRAKAELSDEVAASLANPAVPTAESVMHEYAVWIGAHLADALPDQGEAAGDVPLLVAELAEALAGLPGEERRRVLAAKWPPEAMAAVLAHLSDLPQVTVAQDVVAAAAADAGYVAEVGCKVMQAAFGTDPGAVLAPTSLASAVLAAIGTGEAASAYAASVGEAADLLRRPVPAAVSRPVAALHAAATRAFDEGVATALARGALVLRLLAPSLPEGLVQELHTPRPDVSDLLDEYVAQVVAAGHAAEAIAGDGEDPDDLVTQRGAALASEGALERCFADPTPADPLGTLPRIAVTALGQAILAARTSRPTDYDWAALADLEEGATNDYLLLLEDERMEVMDLIPLPA